MKKFYFAGNMWSFDDAGTGHNSLFDNNHNNINLNYHILAFIHPSGGKWVCDSCGTFHSKMSSFCSDICKDVYNKYNNEHNLRKREWRIHS